jgi:hypothetical protein
MTTTTAAMRDQSEPVSTALDRFVRFLETGQVSDGLFAPDVFCDLTVPTWRLQAEGVPDTVGLRLGGHPSPSRVTVRRVDPIPSGFVVEFEERWRDDADDWYCRELIRADVTDGAITQLSIYCTGDWDTARVAEHAAAVRLPRP